MSSVTTTHTPVILDGLTKLNDQTQVLAWDLYYAVLDVHHAALPLEDEYRTPTEKVLLEKLEDKMKKERLLTEKFLQAQGTDDMVIEIRYNASTFIEKMSAKP